MHLAELVVAAIRIHQEHCIAIIGRIAKLHTHWYFVIMSTVADIADVHQGLARAGHGAGARSGDWALRIVESGDLRSDGWLELDGLREIGVLQGVRTERHLLRPFDVLVTARSGSVHVALAPPDVSRTVAGVTMLVVRPQVPESGMGHWLWFVLASSYGRTQIERRLTVSATVISLSAQGLGGIEIPVPSERDLDVIARLMEASEAAYAAEMRAARLRREILRDALVAEFGRQAAPAAER